MVSKKYDSDNGGWSSQVVWKLWQCDLEIYQKGRGNVLSWHSLCFGCKEQVWFWLDSWFDESPLSILYKDLFLIASNEEKICFWLISNNKGWCGNKEQHPFENEGLSMENGKWPLYPIFGQGWGNRGICGPYAYNVFGSARFRLNGGFFWLYFVVFLSFWLLVKFIIFITWAGDSLLYTCTYHWKRNTRMLVVKLKMQQHNILMPPI